jgi:dihydropteroate synthase
MEYIGSAVALCYNSYMQEFVVKQIVTQDTDLELLKIGFDSGYCAKAAEKYKYKVLKILDLTPAQANILKQTALIFGTDCAVHRDVITGKIDFSDVILGGSYSQLHKIASKLRSQPFSLSKLADEIIVNLSEKLSKTKLVGILNITPDSFSDGGRYFVPKDAINRFYQLIEDGADIIDIGAESTRPFSKGISPEVQIERLSPVLKEIKSQVPVSIDTRSSKVARFALENGAVIINDVSGFDYDTDMAEVVAEYDAGVVLQHSKGTPDIMQNNPKYSDVVEEVYMSLSKKAQFAKEKGIRKIILDVGIGFGKSREDNFELINRIEEFFSLKYPLMVGVSRKSFLGIDIDDNNIKDALTLAVSYPLIKSGVEYLRVHNVKLHKQLINSIRT